MGYDILKGVAQFEKILPIVLYHHEAWNGRGYPHGLVGEASPLLARIVAVADSFDVMTSNRAYRQGMPLDKVEGILREQSGNQWTCGLLTRIRRPRRLPADRQRRRGTTGGPGSIPALGSCKLEPPRVRQRGRATNPGKSPGTKSMARREHSRRLLRRPVLAPASLRADWRRPGSRGGLRFSRRRDERLFRRGPRVPFQRRGAIAAVVLRRQAAQSRRRKLVAMTRETDATSCLPAAILPRRKSPHPRPRSAN